jgi:serine/threonine protein kinase
MTSTHVQTFAEGRYEVSELLGQGAGSTVFAGHDTVLARRVAIKVVKPEYADAYQSALDAAGKVSHPAFIGIFDAFEQDEQQILVLEYSNGAPFKDIILSEVSPLDVARMGRSLALALAHAHRVGIPHGDLTPSSLFRDHWNPSAIRINNLALPPDLDYFAAAGKLLTIGEDRWVPSTPKFRDDVRAIGVILWLLLARRVIPPAELTGTSEDWMFIDYDVPEELRDVIERLADPSHPRSIDTAEDLVSILGVTAQSLNPKHPAQAIPPWDRPITAKPLPEMRPIEQLDVPQVAPTPIAVQTEGGQLIVGTPPAPESENAATWAGVPGMRQHKEMLSTTQHSVATPNFAPAQQSRGGRASDYILWGALGIGLFLFWLVIGYLVPGLFGK